MTQITKLLGLFILTSCLIIIYLFETSASISGAFRVFHWPAILLTGIGPFGLVLLSTEWKRLVNTWHFIMGKSPNWWEKVSTHEAVSLHKISRQYYVNGTKAFDQVNKEEFSPMLRRVIERISMRVPIRDVRDLVERERTQTESHLVQSLKIIGLGLRLSPSIGMLGTILGMVQLLSSLKDPSHIGSHMSLALLTTFYGLFFSLILWTPLQSRLDSLLDARMQGFTQVLHWLELLEQRKPVQYFEDNLNQDQLVLAKEKVIKPAIEAEAK